jgi:hypothetical protein
VLRWRRGQAVGWLGGGEAWKLANGDGGGVEEQEGDVGAVTGSVHISTVTSLVLNGS